MPHTIEIIDDKMCMVDEHGVIDDAVALVQKAGRQAQLQAWQAEYTINVCDAYRKLHDYFADRWQAPCCTPASFPR